MAAALCSRHAARRLVASSAACAASGRHGRQPPQQQTQTQGGRRAARRLPVVVLRVAKQDREADAVAQQWADKARRYAPLEEVVVKTNPKNTQDTLAATEEEGRRCAKHVADNTDLLVLLDERGRDVSSEGLAELVAGAGDNGYKRLVFAIGGPFGHGTAVRERADDSVKLSRCVLNHQVARIVLLEQVYRAWSILDGSSYHH